MDKEILLTKPKQWELKLKKSHARSHSRIEKELGAIESSKTSKSQIEFSETRAVILKCCFEAAHWSELVSGSFTSQNEAKNLSRSLRSTAPVLDEIIGAIRNNKVAANILAYDVLVLFAQKGFKVHPDQRTTVEEILCSFLEALKDCTHNELRGRSHLQYGCLGLGTRMLNDGKRIDKETALTIQLSRICRVYTSGNNSIYYTIKLKELRGYGKPCLKQSAAIALCAINEVPPTENEVNALVARSKNYCARNGEVSLFSNWS